MRTIATRYDILSLLPPGHIVGVEVGTDTGINARELLLSRPDLFLWTVDPYGYCLGYEEHKDPGRAIARRIYEERVGEFVRAGRTKHVELPSTEAAKHFSGRLRYGNVERCMSFQFVYIDGDHSEGAVREDLEAWWPLLLDGGIMAGHDFEDPAVHTPVIQFAKAHRQDLHIINEHGTIKDEGSTPGSGYDNWGGWAHPSFVIVKSAKPRFAEYSRENVNPYNLPREA